ncbi:MAG: hypothetical protein QW191_03585 [Conexivisphaerales archaeon]
MVQIAEKKRKIFGIDIAVLSKFFNSKRGVKASIRQKEITARGHSFCSPQRRFVLNRVISKSAL